MDISRNSLPRIGSTTLDVARPAEHHAPSFLLTLPGGTYSITPRTNGQPLSGEALSAFAQACKPYGKVHVIANPRGGGGKLAIYRARLQSNSSDQAFMDVIVHLGKNDLPTRMQASEMNLFALSSGQQGRALFNIQIHHQGERARR